MFKSLTAAVAVTLLLVLAPGAQASDPLAGGSTTLKLDAGVAKALKAAGVKVSGTTYAITGGSLASGGATGTIKHSGALKLSAGGTSLALKQFTVKLGKTSTLSGLVGKTRVTLLTLNTSKAKITRAGLNTKITGVSVALTSVAAKALNATFSTHLFSKGLRLGTVAVTAKPKSVGLTGGATTVTLDPGTAAALTSLGVTAAPIGGDSLAFPITGGRLDAKTFAGTITHSGGISLSKGSTSVALTDFAIGIDSTPELTALVGGARVPILTVDLSALETDTTGGTITLTGATLKLTAAAANALNQAFATTAFTEGLVLGTAAVRANPPTTSRAASVRTFGATTLKLDAGAVAALTGLGVAPAPIAPATALPSGELSFPILNPPFSALLSGVIRHSGGIALTAGTVTVDLEDFNIDPLRRQLTAIVGGSRVPILDLNFAQARIGLGGRALNLGPVAGSLTAVAAGALNAAFGLPAGTVPPGLKLGDATVRYRLF